MNSTRTQLLIDLTKEMQAHSDNMVVKPFIIFEESVVPKGLENEGMDSIVPP